MSDSSGTASGCVLQLDHDEAVLLRAMLREQVVNDMDLLEDLAYADLDDTDSDGPIARVALAVRLDVALEA